MSSVIIDRPGEIIKSLLFNAIDADCEMVIYMPPRLQTDADEVMARLLEANGRPQQPARLIWSQIISAGSSMSLNIVIKEPFEIEAIYHRLGSQFSGRLSYVFVVTNESHTTEVFHSGQITIEPED